MDCQPCQSVHTPPSTSSPPRPCPASTWARPLPRSQSKEELGRNLLICTRDEMIDLLSAYAEAGIDEVISTSNYGQSQAETLDMMARFASEVMPHLKGLRQRAVA